jgi:hypothetical protein
MRGARDGAATCNLDLVTPTLVNLEEPRPRDGNYVVGVVWRFGVQCAPVAMRK